MSGISLIDRAIWLPGGGISEITRSLARLRSACPILPLLIGFLSGQLAGFYSSIWVMLGLLVLLGLSFARRKYSGVTRPACMGLLLGWISMLVALGVEPEGLPAGNYRLVLEVLSAPRRPQPGMLRFDARVQNVLEAISQMPGESFRPEVRGLNLRCRAVDLPWREVNGLQRGDVLAVISKVSREETPAWPFEYSATLRRHGITGSCRVRYAALIQHATAGAFERLNSKIRAKVISILGNNEHSGMLLALVLGQRDGLSIRTEKAFQRAGLSHLLVLSGYQVSLVYGLLYGVAAYLLRVLRLVGAKLRNFPALFASCGSVLFVALVGIDNSSLRAILALGFVVLARMLERKTSLWNSLANSLFFLCLVWPGSFLEPGVQLTYAALVGIAVGSSPTGRVDRKLRVYLRTSFWATLLPLTVSALWFGNFSAGGLLLNPIAAPLFSVLGTLLGGICIALDLAHFDPGGLLIRALAAALISLREVVVEISRLSWVTWTLNVPEECALAAGVSMLLLWELSRVLRWQQKSWNFWASTEAQGALIGLTI